MDRTDRPDPLASLAGATVVRRRLAALAVVAVAGLLLFLRRPDALLRPQFLAEDGMFFVDAYEMGPAALATPYNGYFHLVPRLTARLALALDPRWAPAVYQAVAFGVWLAVLLALFSPRIRLPAKPALALALVLVPHSGEVFLSLTNVQWPLAVGLLLLALADDPAGPRQGAADLAALILCGLTGPFAIFLWPLFLARALARRSRASLLLVVGVSAAAALQAVTLYRYRFLFVVKAPPDPAGVLSALGGRLYGTFFAGYGLADFRPGAGWMILGAGLTALGAWAIFSARTWSRNEKMLAGAWLCVVAPVALRFLRRAAEISGPRNGDRYFFLPHVLLAWILVVAAVRTAGWRRGMLVAALAVALAATLPHWRVPPLHDYGWAGRVQPIRDGKGFLIPINPEGWTIRSAGRDSRRE